MIVAMASRKTPSGTRRAARARAPPPAPARRLDLAATRLRPLVERPHLSAGLLIALVVLVYLWPVLIGRDILSPLAILYYVPPWRGSAPSDVANYTNLVLSDVPTAVYPWRFLVRELLHHGTFPAWDPHVFAGTPLYSNPQTGLFSPFSIPLWVLPLNYAIGLVAALKLWVAGFGTYLLARQLRLNFLPGVLAGVAFAFSALNIVWLTHETLPAVAAMLPWMVLLVERIFDRGRLGSALWLAVVTAAALGGGHPGMQVHVVAVTGLYLLLRAAFTPAGEGPSRVRALAIAGGGLGLGALLMGVMLVPELLSSHGTIGTLARQGGGGSLPGSHTSLAGLKTTVFPDWWGRPSANEVPEAMILAQVGNVNYNERTFYAGTVALLLACTGLAAGGAWRRKAPFVVLAALGILIPLHTPGIYTLVEHLPGIKLVQNQRLYFAYGFGTAVLGAFGLQRLLDGPPRERRRLVVMAVALAGGLVALLSINTLPGDVSATVKHFVSGVDSSSPAVLALTSVVWFLLFALGVGGGVLVVWRWPRRRAVVAVGLVLLAALDGYHFAYGYQPMAPASRVVPPRTPAIVYLQRHAGGGRFAGLGTALVNDWGLVYGLNDVRGYDVPQPTVRFYRLWLAANPLQRNWQTFAIPVLTPASLDVMSVLGARFLVAGPDLGSTAGLPLRRVYAGADATVLENPNATPRAMVASSVRLTSGQSATRTALVEARFDPRRTVVVERDQPGVAALAAGSRAPGSGTAAVVHEDNASVMLHASLTRRGLVMLDDDFTDGWSVRVDGRTAPALHVDDVMRGVIVGPGRHEILWSYTVPGLGSGLLLSLVGLMVLVGGAIVLRARRRPGR
jgi:hypothetical protein